MEEHIAETVIELNRQELPAEIVHLLKRNLLDSYAGICASLFDFEMIENLRSYAALVPDENGATVWGARQRAQLIQAVFMNSILGRRSDLVNTYLSPNHMGGNHPSDNVALLLTLAQPKNLSGRELLRAMHLAYNLSCAFSDYYNPEAGGYDHDAQAPFYTALICGYLEGLDVAGLVQAQRIAGAMGLDTDQAGLGPVTDWKHCTYASCAMRGLSAALMAKAGFQGPVEIYQGAAGLDRFMPHAENFMAKPPDLGSIVFKQWQALVFCQTAIDAALQLSPAFKADELDQVESIRVEIYEKALEEAGGDKSYQPGSRAGRTHSLPYCVAATLLQGKIDYDSFGPGLAQDRRMLALMKKIQLRADPEMTARFPEKAPCAITIQYKNQPPQSARLDRPHGDPKDPLSDTEISDKAKGYLSRLTSENQAHDIIEKMWMIEEQNDLSWLLQPLQQGAPHD